MCLTAMSAGRTTVTEAAAAWSDVRFLTSAMLWVETSEGMGLMEKEDDVFVHCSINSISKYVAAPLCQLLARVLDSSSWKSVHPSRQD